MIACLWYIPDSATSAMGTPCSWAMNPSTENTAKPATTLVPLFSKHSIRESLQITKAKCSHCMWQNMRLLIFKYLFKIKVNNYWSSCTYSSCCCICCSFPAQLGSPHRYCRRRRSDSQPPSTPVPTKQQYYTCPPVSDTVRDLSSYLRVYQSWGFRQKIKYDSFECSRKREATNQKY